MATDDILRFGKEKKRFSIWRQLHGEKGGSAL
jgi:hypothetical protein